MSPKTQVSDVLAHMTKVARLAESGPDLPVSHPPLQGSIQEIPRAVSKSLKGLSPW